MSPFPLAIALATTLCLSQALAQTREVLLAESADHSSSAVFVVDQGLVLRRARRPALTIGHGSEPRFDRAGRLFFTRSFDDGSFELRRETWVLDAGAAQPRRIHPGERVPAFVARAAVAPSATIRVCVDAGHGGSDPGARGNGLLEKDITLDVAKRLEALLILDTADTRGGGAWNVLMTRRKDVFVSLSGRTTAANSFGAKTFVSVHMNAASSSQAHGSETYCFIGQELKPGGLYRNRLHRELIAAWGLRDRGVKSANFFVLRRTSMPASLVEGGFITNAGDAAKLRDPAARQRLALGLLWATQEFHGFRRYTPGGGGGGTKKGKLRGIVYDATKGTRVRILDATVSLSDGAFRRTTPFVGAFVFDLPIGTYTYAVSAAGFAPAQLTRTVKENADTWGSFALQPANVPALRVDRAPKANALFTISLSGDAGSPAVLLLSDRPQLPLTALAPFGTLWPNVRNLVTAILPPIPSSGQLTLKLRAPNARGFRAHLQAFVLRNRAFRLSNGAGMQTQ